MSGLKANRGLPMVIVVSPKSDRGEHLGMED